MQIILASASKRRKDLLRSLGLRFKVVPAQVDEGRMIRAFGKIKEVEEVKSLVKKIALNKALEVKERIKEKNYLIISADTVVFLKNKIIGKPKNREGAEEMLRTLRGKRHQVITGVVLLGSKGRKKTFCEISRVDFKNFSDQDLIKYLKTDLWQGKAGAYGIQDKEFGFVKNYQGSYTNIVGLPLGALKDMLEEYGIKTSKQQPDY